MPKRLTTKGFIEKARIIHGNRYDYTLTKYVNSRTNVLIICSEHGEFEQQAKRHLMGRGCPKCGRRIGGHLKRQSNEDFIRKSRKKHGNRYDYTLTKYVNSRTNVLIICSEHGEFEQNPKDHYSGSGCPKCSRSENAKRQLFEHTIVIQKFIDTHGSRYDYKKVNYTGIDDKVTIICNEHGEFFQTPFSHIKGSGCPVCGMKKFTSARKIDPVDVIKRFNEVHGDRYDYSYVKFRLMTEKVVLFCKEHGKFKQRPHDHLKGNGCPKCAEINRIITRLKNYEFRKIESITLYRVIIFHTDECFFKIGYTTYNVEKRFKNLFAFYGYKILVIEERTDSIQKVAEEEQNFIIRTNLNPYIPEKRHRKRIMDGGRRECFELPKKYEHLYFKMMGAYHDLPIILYELPDWLK